MIRTFQSTNKFISDTDRLFMHDRRSTTNYRPRWIKHFHKVLVAKIIANYDRTRGMPMLDALGLPLEVIQ